MVNRRRDPRTGRFVGRFASLQTLRQLADLPEHEWATDGEAWDIYVAGKALAIQQGWVPPVGSEVRS